MARIYDYYLDKKYFEKDRNDKLAARIARHDFKKGDILRFHEMDEKGKKTGRYYDRVIVDLHKIQKALKFWNIDDLMKYGFAIFELKPAK